MPKIKLQPKKYLSRKGLGEGLALRVSHQKERKTGKNKTVSARYTVKCGCCQESVVICYGEDDDTILKINGVSGSVKNWREILLPLLRIEQKGVEFKDVSPEAQRARRTLRSLRKKYPFGQKSA